MFVFFKRVFTKARDYDTQGIVSKIELRRAQVFNYTILLECVILLVNSVRHFFRESYQSVMVVGASLFFLLFLFFTQKIKRENKYSIFILLGLIVTLFFMHFVDSTKDIIQVLIATIVSTGVFLAGNRFRIFFVFSVGCYYFAFFNLAYHTVYNPLGVLSFVFLTLMMRMFIKDAEQNEIVIEKQVVELKELDSLKSRLFANISHEIRTPLTLIMGANEQLEVSRFSQIIKSNANKLLELVNQIIELSKIDAKQRKLAISVVNLQEYMHALVLNFDSLALHKDIQFVSAVTLPLPLYCIDEDAFYKIVSNLLMNAFKFSVAGDQVSLKVRQEANDWLEVVVSDTGSGIDPANLPHIFEQFYYSKVGLEASSGIGLALVKDLVQALGGQITVTSQVGQGSVFTVKLPCLQQHYSANAIFLQEETMSISVSEQAMVSFESDTPVLSQTAKEVLLLVEDNQELRGFVKGILEEQFQVIEAVDGIDGKEKALQLVPDIILSDVMMPNMNGLELLKTLKEDMTTSHIPFLLLTAKAEEEDIVEGLKLQADDYITKPFHKKELLYRIQNKLALLKKWQEKYQGVVQANYQSDTVDSKEDKFLKMIVTVVKQNLSNSSFGPEELAVEIGLSTSQIFRKLKALTNSSTSIFMRNIRLEEAKILLANQSATVSEIAYETGFSSPSYFAKCFKEYTSTSPTEFVLLAKKE
ncbi:hybrid sensor histidine kinase/response regulator transcription factor [Flavobacterium sp.]|uniref:hybrid sensor histidine kinase/response regulator transcription factor n=1 Tax=Flavobacterium sp. TaxID=239 RepID=UPI003D0ACB5A